MFGLNALRNAIATLAANLTGLAHTVAEVNASLRQRAALDGPEVEPLTLAAPLAANGPSVPQDATGGEPAPASPGPRNGRKRATAEA